MYSADRALQIISIQYELVMNIGLDQRLENMLSSFMQRTLQRLSLSMVMLVDFNQCELTDDPQGHTEGTSYCFPQVDAAHGKWLISEAKLFYYRLAGDHYYIGKQLRHSYFLNVPQFGVLILERESTPLDEMILAALKPLLVKLSASCQACQEHQNLIKEVEARKLAETQLIEQSMIDPQSGLANRKKFNLSLLSALSSSINSKEIGAIFIFDLDRFKVINNTLGHEVGDEVINILGQRLQECMRPGDTLARIGGDEFALLVVDLSLDESIAFEKSQKIAKKLGKLISAPIKVGDNVFSISNSTGVNLFPLDVDSSLSMRQQADVIVKNADLAMNSVKQANRNGYNFYNKELQSYSQRKAQIENCLQTAIFNNEFEVYYQPLVAVDGKVLGAEALLRWSNQSLGRVGPDEFIPIAEESGLILDIGAWVLEQVCQILSSIASNEALKYISVNVSPRQFIHHNFANDLLGTLNKYGINSRQIRVEVTEGVVIDNIDLTIQKMRYLKDNGVVTMLDDFGSGYSSLSYLHQLPLQTIKIDKSFITDIEKTNRNHVIVDSIIDICEHFSLECIVEGVENCNEFEYLATKNITAYQGYYFHRPMPKYDFIALLEQ
ncbi:MAG: bifunctional diguanylate cyclase/phosphodiesterase [Paraglaciecola sp.]|uniref:putative bifunctional diguanylate cyclase/phosphodiesterase n=1 Tax=Paraglaciecola sp. TaxID=1920173 RepID=UPI0032986557